MLNRSRLPAKIPCHKYNLWLVSWSFLLSRNVSSDIFNETVPRALVRCTYPLSQDTPHHLMLRNFPVWTSFALQKSFSCHEFTWFFKELSENLLLTHHFPDLMEHKALTFDPNYDKLHPVLNEGLVTCEFTNEPIGTRVFKGPERTKKRKNTEKKIIKTILWIRNR